MREIKTSKGTWKLHGVNVIPEDTIYREVQKAIEEDNLTEAHLQAVTGQRAPIDIDFKNQTVTFQSW